MRTDKISVLFSFMRFPILVIVSTLLAGCGLLHVPTSTEISGEYVYKYKSGEIEVWILRQDSTYQQEFYQSVKKYRQRVTPAYTNSGNWSLIKNKITMVGTLNFLDYTNLDRALSKPLHVAAQPGEWVAPSGQDDAEISIGEDIDYVLFRTKSRDLVKDNRTNP